MEWYNWLGFVLVFLGGVGFTLIAQQLRREFKSGDWMDKLQ